MELFRLKKKKKIGRYHRPLLGEKKKGTRSIVTASCHFKGWWRWVLCFVGESIGHLMPTLCGAKCRAEGQQSKGLAFATGSPLGMGFVAKGAAWGLSATMQTLGWACLFVCTGLLFLTELASRGWCRRPTFGRGVNPLVCRGHCHGGGGTL